MIKYYIIISMIIACIEASASEGVTVIRGTRKSDITTNTPLMSAEYAVVEVGRGNISKKTVEVLFRENSDNQPLPLDAILLLHGPSFSKKPDFGSYLLISPDAAQGIIPYSAAAWSAVLQKTDKELSDAPEVDRLPVEEAILVLKMRLYEKYETPLHIYIYPPRRVSYSWSLSALCVRNGAVKKLRIRVGDNGKILNETPNHRPIKFFDSPEVTNKEMDQFVRDYNHNLPPKEWPRLDTDSASSNPSIPTGYHDTFP